jgi:hypothetical protein
MEHCKRGGHVFRMLLGMAWLRLLLHELMQRAVSLLCRRVLGFHTLALLLADAPVLRFRSQMLRSASAFNRNIAAWNVLRVSNVASAFDSTTALAVSTKGTMYMMWGATLQAAYPTWACGNTGMLTCITDANIATAVTAWVTSPSTAATTYGPIGYWNTAAVTSMASLFYPSSTARPTLNDDISKWNTASVSNMYQVCSRSIARMPG